MICVYYDDTENDNEVSYCMRPQSRKSIWMRVIFRVSASWSNRPGAISRPKDVRPHL